MSDQSNPIIVEKVYAATIDRVWRAITNKDEMKKWYFELSDFKPEVGFEFQFYGKGKQGDEFVHLCQVTEVVNQKKLTYSWRYKGYEGNSFVTFELFPEGNATRLKLIHKGLETFPVTAHNDFARENFAEGWAAILNDLLRKYIESQ